MDRKEAVKTGQASAVREGFRSAMIITFEDFDDDFYDDFDDDDYFYNDYEYDDFLQFL